MPKLTLEITDETLWRLKAFAKALSVYDEYKHDYKEDAIIAILQAIDNPPYSYLDNNDENNALVEKALNAFNKEYERQYMNAMNKLKI